MRHKVPSYQLTQKRRRRRSKQMITSRKLRVQLASKASGLDDCGGYCGRCDVCKAGI